jgi:hypothetical protein
LGFEFEAMFSSFLKFDFVLEALKFDQIVLVHLMKIILVVYLMEIRKSILG